MPLLIRAATGRDLPAIASLLASFALPTSGVADHLSEFLIAEDAGVIVASAAIEVYLSCALLRSVAVRRDYQGRGWPASWSSGSWIGPARMGCTECIS